MARKKKKKEGFCYVYMTDAELMLYSPDFYETKEEALKVLIEDCHDIAAYNGYRKDQLFMPGVGMLLNRVEFIWDHWSELEEDDGQDNEGRAEADNQ